MRTGSGSARLAIAGSTGTSPRNAANAASNAASDGVGRGSPLRLGFFLAAGAFGRLVFELVEVERDLFMPLLNGRIV